MQTVTFLTDPTPGRIIGTDNERFQVHAGESFRMERGPFQLSEIPDFLLARPLDQKVAVVIGSPFGGVVVIAAADEIQIEDGHGFECPACGRLTDNDLGRLRKTEAA